MSASVRSIPRSIDDPVLGELIDQIGQRLQGGEALDIEALAAEHPGYAEQIRRLVPALQVLADFSRSANRADLFAASNRDMVEPRAGDR